MGVVKDMEVARRIARAVVSDIALYNAKKVEEGVRNDNLFEILREEIEEGQGYYLSRVDPEIAKNTN
jgi:EAL domain-containing protein (putative c-di-GMP-specific phosphodiesterase class I)